MASRKKTVSDVPMAASPMREKDYAEREKRYRAEEAIRTLTRADEIRKDRGLMRDVKSEAKRQAKTLGAIAAPRKRP